MPRLKRDEQNQLLMRIYNLSRVYAQQMIREQEVDDVVHEVAERCLISLRRNRGLRRIDEFEKFVYTIVRNRIRDRRRTRDVRRSLDAEYLSARTHTHPAWMEAHVSLDDESIAKLQSEIMGKVPYLPRLAYYYFHREDKSHAQIAAVMKISVNTVKNYLAQARNIFRTELVALDLIRPAGDTPPALRRKWRRTGQSIARDYPVTTAIDPVTPAPLD